MLLNKTERIASLSLISFAIAAGITGGIIGLAYTMDYYGYWFKNTKDGIQDIEVKPISNHTLTIDYPSSGLATIEGQVSALSFGHVPSGTPFGGYMQYKGTPPGGKDAGAGRGLFAAGIIPLIGAFTALLTFIPMRKIVMDHLYPSLFLVGGAALLTVSGGLILGYMLNPQGNVFGGSKKGIQGITLAYTGSAPTFAPTPSGNIITQTSGQITDIVFGNAKESGDQGAQMSVSTQSIALGMAASFGISSIAFFIFPAYIIFKNNVMDSSKIFDVPATSQ